MRRSFDLLARPYRAMETLAFGRALHRARTAHLARIPTPTNVLILGEGNGRFLQSFRALHPTVPVRVVDLSPAMLALARSRDPSPHTAFTQADATQLDLPENAYDLVVTHFFLDCFPEPAVRALVEKLSRAATPTATWLLADFHQPAHGLSALHARLWLATMYAFFRLATGLPARSLVAPDPHLIARSFRLAAEARTRFSLIRSTAWRRDGILTS